jgi:hypothetical protein
MSERDGHEPGVRAWALRLSPTQTFLADPERAAFTVRQLVIASRGA